MSLQTSIVARAELTCNPQIRRCQTVPGCQWPIISSSFEMTHFNSSSSQLHGDDITLQVDIYTLANR